MAVAIQCANHSDGANEKRITRNIANTLVGLGAEEQTEGVNYKIVLK
jgi:hypothetical protein